MLVKEKIGGLQSYLIVYRVPDTFKDGDSTFAWMARASEIALSCVDRCGKEANQTVLRSSGQGGIIRRWTIRQILVAVDTFLNHGAIRPIPGF